MGKKSVETAGSIRRAKTPKPSVSYPQEPDIQTIIENIGEVIYKVDIHTKQFTFVSPQVNRVLGYTPEEFLDIMNSYRRTPFYYEEDRQRVVAGRYNFLVTCLNEGMQELYEAEYRVKRKNGDVIWVKEHVYPSYSPDGIIESFVGSIEDITEDKRARESLHHAKEQLEMRVQERTAELNKTNKVLRAEIAERKRIQEVLQQSEEKYRILFESKLHGVVVIDETMKLLLANQAAADIIGVDSTEELLEMNPFDFIPPEEREQILKILTGDMFENDLREVNELRLINKNGEEVWISAVGTLIKYEGKLAGLASFTDITERKRAEETLQESERKYRELADSLPEIIFELDERGNFTFANRQAFQSTGYTLDDFDKGLDALQMFVPEDRDRVRVNIQRILSGETLGGNEYTALRKDGSTFPVIIYSTPIIHDGKPAGLRGIVIDITERKQAENTLRESEQRFRGIFQGAPIGIELYDSSGELLTVNRACLDIFGVSNLSEVMGFKLFEDPNLSDELKDRLRNGKRVRFEAPFDFEKVRQHKLYKTSKSGIIYLDTSITPLGQGREGSLTGYLVQVQDITERRQIEMALRQSEEFSSGLLRNSPNPIVVLGVDASIRYVNSALERLTGFSSAELIGRKPPYPWWIEETIEESGEKLVNAIRSGSTKFEQLLRKKNGEQFWVEINHRTVKVDGEFKYHLANWVDLTEQKRLRENMGFYISQITRAQEEERKRIAREIHDESVQSLSALALDIDAIAKDKERLPRDIIPRLKGIRRQINGVLDGLRRFSHELRPGVIDQVGLVPALEILTEELNKEGNISTSLEIMGHERHLTSEIRLALFRIAQEALNNIRKHSGATKATIRVKFTRKKIRLTVADNGRGFEVPEMLSDFAGEGKLGLIGMQERARLFDGKFLLKSWVGRGTTVITEIET